MVLYLHQFSASAVVQKMHFFTIQDKFVSYLIQIYHRYFKRIYAETAPSMLGAIWDEFSEHQSSALYVHNYKALTQLKFLPFYIDR